MPIDIQEESVCTLSELARRYDVHVCTIHRWRLRGIKGIRLETIRIGGKRLSSFEAGDRFNERVTAAADGEPVPRAESSGAREKRLARVEAELAKCGI